jgi:exosortase/archaeosortase family protein
MLLVVPIAIFANAARVAVTGVLAHYRGIRVAEGFFHGFAGWLVFIFELALLVAAYGALNYFERIVGKKSVDDEK